MIRQTLIAIFSLLIISSCQDPLADVVNDTADYPILPKVNQLEIKKGRFRISKHTSISGDQSLTKEGIYLAQMLSEVSGISIPFDANAQGNISLQIDNTLPAEAYRLSVDHKKITLVGSSPKAIFYGIQTINQLLPAAALDSKEDLTIPAANISDAPRFAYRGMHLDVCRHFFSIDFVRQYVDLLAMHKMNTLHWHLTEDQGWRIEIKKYPKLTEIGAWRNGTIVGHYPGERNDNERHGGYYTQDQIREVIDYAADRHITIIPEIELPGHSSAAIAAYPSLSCFPDAPSIVPNDMMSDASRKAQAAGSPKIVQESWGVYDDVYCAGKEETFVFVEDVLTEVMDLFPSKYIHIGGDECPKGNWKKCPKCQQRKQEHGLADEHELQSYFINRVEKFVNSKGRNIIGWDEILEGGLAPNATVMSWRGNAGGIEAAKAHHTVIMSPNSHCYFDHYQSKDTDNEPLAIGGYLPLQKVYAFDPIPPELGAEQHKYILGGQANLWTEYIGTESKAQYMLLPRLSALSEALWSSPDTKEWEDFNTRLDMQKRRFEALGINFAKVE